MSFNKNHKISITDLNKIINTGANEGLDKENNLQLTEKNWADIVNRFKICVLKLITLNIKK